jgi:hypothetical protein
LLLGSTWGWFLAACDSRTARILDHSGPVSLLKALRRSGWLTPTNHHWRVDRLARTPWGLLPLHRQIRCETRRSSFWTLRDYYEDYEVEVEQLQAIKAIADSVYGAFPELRERATELARSAVERQIELEQEMDERDIPYRPRQQPLADPARNLTASRRHVDEVTIDIDMLFSDL